MSAEKFEEELSLLISRWTKSPVLNTNDADNLAPLTKQQLLNTIKSVVQVKLGVNLQETPQAGIAAGIKQEQSSRHSRSFRSESLDDLLRMCDDDQLLSKTQEEKDIVKSNTLELLPGDKKFISRSTPTIHKPFTDKPDTFIHERAEKRAAEKVTEQQGDKSKVLLDKIEVLRKCASDVVTKLGELRTDMYLQTEEPIIRPISIAASPGLGASSSVLWDLPPPDLRRATIGVAGTSKKLNTTVTLERERAAARRKTIYPGSLLIKPLKMSPSSRSPSVAGSSSKKSPTSILKTGRNPKYAHIQSTIPKVVQHKKPQ